MLKNYIKIAFRNVMKNPGYSAINILGLAVGITICVLIFRYIAFELSYDRYHEASDRLYRVTLHTQNGALALTPSIISPVMLSNIPEVEEAVRVYNYGAFRPVVLRNGDNVFEENSFAYADSSLFSLFDFDLLNGNPANALARPYTVVLSSSSAQKYFGMENPVGKTLLLNNERELEVTGVMKDIPENSHFRFDFITSLESRRNWGELSDTEMRGAQFYTYVKLRKDSNIQTVQSKLDELVSRYVDESFSFALHLQPITDIHLYSRVEHEIQQQGDIRYVMAAGITALMILIIACINYMNLATARSVGRAKEVGIRKVMGSDRRTLMKQFFGEAAFLTAAALLCAVILTELLTPWFTGIMGQSVSEGFIGFKLLWVLLAIGAVVTLFAGSYPALVLSSYNPAMVLTGGKSSAGSAGLRKALVIFQFGISVFLIVGTMIVHSQIEFIRHKELGFKKDQVLSLGSHTEVENRFEAFRSEMIRLPGVENMTMGSHSPVEIGSGYKLEIEGLNIDPNTVVRGIRVRHEFNETFEIDVIAGRTILENDFLATNRPDNPEYSFLLNEAATRAFNAESESLINRRMNVHGRQGTIIGIVEDFHFNSMHAEIEPLIMFPQDGFNKVFISLNSADISGTVSDIERIWKEFFPQFPFQYEFVDQQFNSLYRSEMQVGRIFTAFSLLAIFIACLGLFGLASYMVEQRSREVGIRKVLGASVTGILALFSFDFMKLVGIGFLIGVPAAWYVMTTWLQNFAYRTEIGPGILVLAGFITLIIALVSVGYQAVKAAMLNPAETIRNE